MKENKKWFLGWTNIKWFIKELIKVGSSEPSYFSKKRIESGIAFFIYQWGSIYYLVKKIDTVVSGDFLIWAGIELAICGYMIGQIEKAKKDITSTTIEQTIIETKPKENENIT